MGKNLYVGTLIIIAVSLCLYSPTPAHARGGFSKLMEKVTFSMPINQIEASKETCEQCHQRVTPMVVAQHKKSRHMKAGLTCNQCHGSDHREMPIVTGKKVCAKCHQKETGEMLASKHAVSWQKMWDNARYQSIPEAMRRQGCGRCHDISYGYNDVRCDYCHTNHQFSVQEAKHPATCSTCHMGPDHPQAEAYEASGHGQKFVAEGKGAEDGGSSATCVTCHQPKGTHNVSLNMGIGGVSNGAVLDSWQWALDDKGKPKIKREVVSGEQFSQARAGNMAICNRCHSQEFNEQWLNGADQVKTLVDQQLLQAEEVVKELQVDGLLYRIKDTGSTLPVARESLVLGGQQLYSGTSKAEAIYFQMYKFAAAQGWKSAYHQDFKRAGNQGIMGMQLLMNELQEEARILRMLGPVKELAPVQEKKAQDNFWWYGFGGLVFGLFLSWAITKRKSRNNNPLLNLILAVSLPIIAFVAPGEAQAWQHGEGAQQCDKCHMQQSGQLRKGMHADLKCLDCHQQDADVTQVRKPETCGRCHGGEGKYEMDTYLTSPHGVQYQIWGLDEWVPTCATCHMPKGRHNQISRLADTTGNANNLIGEVCRRCHTTDHVLKFSKDKSEIEQATAELKKKIEQVGQNLVDKGIIKEQRATRLGGERQEVIKWPGSGLWTLVNIDVLAPEEQETVKNLITQLENKTQSGLTELPMKTNLGAAHVNPDYTHWYGNAYSNLYLSEIQGTAKELERFAVKTGYTGQKKDEVAFSSTSKELLVMGLGLVLGCICFVIVRFNRIEWRGKRG